MPKDKITFWRGKNLGPQRIEFMKNNLRLEPVEIDEDHIFEIYHFDKNKMELHREGVHRTHEGAHKAMDTLITRKKEEFFNRFEDPEKVKEESPDIFYQDHGFLTKMTKVEE